MGILTDAVQQNINYLERTMSRHASLKKAKTVIDALNASWKDCMFVFVSDSSKAVVWVSEKTLMGRPAYRVGNMGLEYDIDANDTIQLDPNTPVEFRVEWDGDALYWIEM